MMTQLSNMPFTSSALNNDAYTKMPATPTHGTIDDSNQYETQQRNNKEEHRSFWQAFMSLMACGGGGTY
ncbi:uncharacterized protein BX663DRAFT_525901 [Cokeromyces recurvatus]|uniref:uncharacterized protein n=1 Tax=Cokeromyces recurvatus TaxID=90255 RepID=UPI00222063DB|nr:uncharacterized protein BX663DRAFT_525901 [Cokeromyces recurvatus]KAI7898163.1 hypothetical protein BX663DRAFT_525901 [Cokeromyces recurvatus]